MPAAAVPPARGDPLPPSPPFAPYAAEQDGACAVAARPPRPHQRHHRGAEFPLPPAEAYPQHPTADPFPTNTTAAAAVAAAARAARSAAVTTDLVVVREPLAVSGTADRESRVDSHRRNRRSWCKCTHCRCSRSTLFADPSRVGRSPRLSLRQRRRRFHRCRRPGSHPRVQVLNSPRTRRRLCRFACCSSGSPR